MRSGLQWVRFGLLALLPTLVWGDEPIKVPALQEADDAPAPFVPKTPRTEAEQKRLDAAAHYAAGRVHESRNQLRKAVDEYRKALELNPAAVEIYRSLVPLTMQLDQPGEAIKLALKGVELDPQDYELCFRVGLEFARQRDFATGIKFLKQAVGSTRLKKESPISVALQVELGNLYQATKQHKEAADCYVIVFDAIKNPEKYELDFRARNGLLADARTNYERIGQVMLEGGRLELASEAFELAAKTNRASVGNLTYHRAKILLLSDKAEQALEELQKYFEAQRQSKGREAYELLADILKKLDRSDELVGRLQALAEADSKNNPLQYFYAEALMKAGDLERAKTVYEAALKNSNDASGYLGLAAVLRRMNRPDELLDVLGRGLEKVGPDALEQLDDELKAIVSDAVLVDALVASGKTQAAAEPSTLTFEEAYLLAKLASELERVDQAVEFYRLAIARGKERAPLAYRELCEILIDNDRYADAAAAYKEALKGRLPGEFKGRFLLGLIQSLELAGDTPGALEAVADAKRQFPIPLFEFQEAWIYYHARKHDEAISRLEQFIKDHPDQTELVRRCQYSLSNIYVLRGELRKGEEILEAVLEEEPDDPAVNNDLGYLYADQGKNLEQAEKMIRKAIAAEPENAAYLDSFGWVLFKNGKVAEAIEPLEKAAKMRKGGDGTIWDHLGDAYHKLGKLPAAADAWKKALEQAQAEKHPDEKLIERIKTKLKEHAPPK